MWVIIMHVMFARLAEVSLHLICPAGPCCFSKPFEILSCILQKGKAYSERQTNEIYNNCRAASIISKR